MSLLRKLFCTRCVAIACAWLISAPVFAEARPRPPVFPADVEPYGLSYDAWAVRLHQWSMAFPASADPSRDTAPVETNQSGRVWFLPSVNGDRTVTRSLTIPAGTALFLSALSIRVNNTFCPTDTNLTVEELTARARELWSTALDVSVTIDGRRVPQLDDPASSPYLVETGPFPITLADHDNQLAADGLDCVPDGATLEPNVALGVYLMLKPLSIGRHSVRITGSAGPEDDPAFVKDVTYEIAVVPAHCNAMEDL